MAEIVAELTKTDQETLDIYQRHTTAKDTLDRVTIKAPVAGVVKGLNYYTEGGVIEPSRPIMDIVPQNEQFIIEAKANPMDIDNIKVGQHVKVQLTSLIAKGLLWMVNLSMYLPISLLMKIVASLILMCTYHLRTLLI